VNFYKRFIGDITAKTGGLSMSRMGAYDRLLDHFYSTELPIAPEEVYSICRAMNKSDREDVDAVLARFWKQTPEGYVQAKAEEVIAKARPLIEAARANGKKGGRPKKQNPEETQPVSTENPEETQGEPSAKAIQSQSQINSVANATGGKPPKDDLSPDAIIFGYGVPYLVEAGCKEAHARSFIGRLRKLHGDEAVIDKLRACLKVRPSQPIEWLSAALPPEKAPPKVEWFETQSGIEERGEALGIGRWDEGAWKSRGFRQADSFSAYKARVMAAHQQGAH
jgi:uncharacterized protein YdaU (DUF1376 family)